MRSLKNPVRPKKLDRFSRSGGCHQSTTAVSLASSAWTPSMLTLELVKIMLDLKNSDFLADNDKPVACTHSKNRHVRSSISSNSLPAILPSSTNSSSAKGANMSPSFSTVTWVNVDGAPVNPNGICFCVLNLQPST